MGGINISTSNCAESEMAADPQGLSPQKRVQMIMEDEDTSMLQPQVDTPIPTGKKDESFKLDPSAADIPSAIKVADEIIAAEQSVEKLTGRYELPPDSEETPEEEYDLNDRTELEDPALVDSLENEDFNQYEDTPKQNADLPMEDDKPEQNDSGCSVLQPDVTQIKPPSPMLDKTTKTKLLNLGQSLDSKKMHDAIGYLDLRQILKAFAKAIMKHIDFSKGLYFTEDLKRLNELMEAEGFEASDNLDFSYNLDSNMKIDIDEFKKLAAERKKSQMKDGEKKNESNFQNMKEMMGGKDGVFEYQPAATPDEELEEPEFNLPEDEDEEIKCTFDDDNDELEYSAEQLEDFMSSLKEKGDPSATQKSDKLVTNFLQNIKSNDPNKTGGKGDKAGMSLRSSGKQGTILSNSLAYSPTNASPLRKGSKMESIESEEEKSSSMDASKEKKEHPHEAAKRQTQEIMLRQARDRLAMMGDEQQLIESQIMESQEELVDVSTKDGMQRYLAGQMMFFHFNFDFETDKMLTDAEGNVPEFMFETHRPSEEDVYYYSKYVVLSGKMEREIPLMALVYIERFIKMTGILINHLNWRRIVMTTLIIASKIWDDDSLENIHFPKVMHDITVKEVNQLEKIILELISFDLHI